MRMDYEQKYYYSRAYSRPEEDGQNFAVGHWLDFQGAFTSRGEWCLGQVGEGLSKEYWADHRAKMTIEPNRFVDAQRLQERFIDKDVEGHARVQPWPRTAQRLSAPLRRDFLVPRYNGSFRGDFWTSGECRLTEMSNEAHHRNSKHFDRYGLHGYSGSRHGVR